MFPFRVICRKTLVCYLKTKVSDQMYVLCVVTNWTRRLAFPLDCVSFSINHGILSLENNVEQKFPLQLNTKQENVNLMPFP